MVRWHPTDVLAACILSGVVGGFVVALLLVVTW